MVHATYQHGPDINEEKHVILKESHFYISDDRTHDIHYVQYCFKLFYDHVIAMDICNVPDPLTGEEDATIHQSSGHLAP